RAHWNPRAKPAEWRRFFHPMASAALASVCPIASVSGRSSPASYRAVRCWSARRGRRRRSAGLRARCAGGQPSAVKPGPESPADDGSVGDEEQPHPQFDLNLAVVLAGFAFEAYSTPPADAGWRETDAAECQTVFLSDVFLREVYDGQLVVRLKKGNSLPAMDPWGTSDPYVVLQLNGQTAKSQIKWGTKEPTWNQDFTFNIRTSLENLLQVEAWDANLITPHKRMGNAGLYLETLCDGNKHDITVELEGLGADGGGTIDLEVRIRSLQEKN
uniref:C2 domain-containing protein n=1 Tax=Aegilops tauschii subsp. strangulata TaxID=200361 RepID=A0A453CEU5_AEGTS